MNHPLTMRGQHVTAATRSTGGVSNVVEFDSVTAGGRRVDHDAASAASEPRSATSTLQAFVAELRKRRVFRAAGSYIVAAWLSAQVIDLICDGFGAPGWILQSFLVAAIIAFPVYLMLAWVYDLTVSGFSLRGAPGSRGTRRPQLDVAIIAVLALVVLFLILVQWQFGSSPAIALPQQLVPMS